MASNMVTEDIKASMRNFISNCILNGQLTRYNYEEFDLSSRLFTQYMNETKCRIPRLKLRSSFYGIIHDMFKSEEHQTTSNDEPQTFNQTTSNDEHQTFNQITSNDEPQTFQHNIEEPFETLSEVQSLFFHALNEMFPTAQTNINHEQYITASSKLIANLEQPTEYVLIFRNLGICSTAQLVKVFDMPTCSTCRLITKTLFEQHPELFKSVYHETLINLGLPTLNCLINLAITTNNMDELKQAIEDIKAFIDDQKHIFLFEYLSYVKYVIINEASASYVIRLMNLYHRLNRGHSYVIDQRHPEDYTNFMNKRCNKDCVVKGVELFGLNLLNLELINHYIQLLPYDEITLPNWLIVDFYKFSVFDSSSSYDDTD